MNVEEFNQKHAVGTPVRYWPLLREGKGYTSRTYTAAFTDENGNVRVHVENHLFAILLRNIEVLDFLQLNEREAVAALSALRETAAANNAASDPDGAGSTEDPETWHRKADEILLASVPEDVREAYLALVRDSPWWVFA